MATTFGRRAGPQARSPTQPAQILREPAAAMEMTAPSAFELAPADTLSLDDELREWKRNRRSGFEIPWSQLSLMASPCFGIASFVLPDSTNDAVNWLLYALMAISLVAGVSRRRKRAQTAATPV